MIINAFSSHSYNESPRGKSHVHVIESFCSFIKRRLTKFNALTDNKFFFYLKEYEFRFNLRCHIDAFPVLWKIWNL